MGLCAVVIINRVYEVRGKFWERWRRGCQSKPHCTESEDEAVNLRRPLRPRHGAVQDVRYTSRDAETVEDTQVRLSWTKEIEEPAVQ